MSWRSFLPNGGRWCVFRGPHLPTGPPQQILRRMVAPTSTLLKAMTVLPPPPPPNHLQRQSADPRGGDMG